MGDMLPRPGGRYISREEFLWREEQRAQQTRELAARTQQPLALPSAESPATTQRRKSPFLLAGLAIAGGVLGYNYWFSPQDVAKGDASNGAESLAGNTQNITGAEGETKKYGTSPNAYLPKPFCIDVVDVNVERSFIPVTWKTTEASFNDANDFPAVVEGTATVKACLTDIGTVRLAPGKTKKAGTPTYTFDPTKFDYSIDPSQLSSYIAVMKPEDLLPVLRRDLGDDSLELSDAQSVIGQIVGHEGEIDARNLSLIKEAIYMREAPILSLATSALKAELEAQAEAQGINPKKIDILPQTSSTNLGFNVTEAPPNETQYFTYEKENAHPQITVVAHQEQSS